MSIITTTTQKRRCSLFRQHSGNFDYCNKLQSEIQEYLEFLELNEREKIITERSPSAQKLPSVEDFFKSLPDLDNYVKTVTEFLNKCQIAQQDQDHINEKLRNLLENLI